MRSYAPLPLCSFTLVLVLLASLGVSQPAAADVFEGISLTSADSAQQSDHASDAAISGDARYVAFDGSFRGRSGVFRRDLLTHEVAIVAEGDAELPSISADGRYVSFTTTARLDEVNDTNAAPDVYVRDMADPDSQPCSLEGEEADEPCAFTLASAVDGSQAGLSYAYSGSETGEEPRYGALASGRSALSADGRRVAFVTTAISNLANPNRPSTPEAGELPETPALQVAVRELDSDRTELVSVLYENGVVAESALGQTQPVPASGSGSDTYGAVFPGGRLTPTFASSFAGASISADGSTVAWVGQQVDRQAPVLPAEPYMSPTYAEPLWRRIGDGPRAATRRVTGGGDPASPACASSGEVAPALPPTLSDPCQGPFDTRPEGSNAGVWSLGVASDYLPRLSADGSKVAFLSSVRDIASGEFGRTGEFSDDLYVVDMREGLARVQALRRLSELAGGNFSEPERAAPIVDLGISPDGSEIAFSTQRTVFPLGSPTYVSAPAAAAGAQELFDIDLANDTLTRVTHSYEGGGSEPANALTGSPSFSSDGDTLAFSSAAYNLVYGDGNGASDAFVVRRRHFSTAAPAQYVSPPPANPTARPDWSLGLSTHSRADGSVLLEADVPSAGTLSAGAHSAVRARRCAHAQRRSCRRAGTTVATRTVASRVVRPRTVGLALAVLKLSGRYGSLAKRPGGLSAYVNVVFTAPGHPKLHQRIAVTFRRTLKARNAHRASASSPQRGGHRS